MIIIQLDQERDAQLQPLSSQVSFTDWKFSFSAVPLSHSHIYTHVCLEAAPLEQWGVKGLAEGHKNGANELQVTNHIFKIM